MKIIIGETAGHSFLGNADLVVSRHATRVDDNGRVIERGFRVGRKRLVDREAFNANPTCGWEVDIWYEWIEGTRPPL